MTQGGPTLSERRESMSNSAPGERRRSFEFYLRPAMMTDAGAETRAFDELPSDVASLVGAVQGLMVHERLIPAYGLELPDERTGESQIRRVELMLRTLLARDKRRLSAARPVGERLVVVCRHFAVLLVTMCAPRAFRLAPAAASRPISSPAATRTIGSANIGTAAPAMDSGRRADRRLPKGHVQAPVRSARRSARSIFGGGRGLGALPRRRSRSPTIRRFRYARPDRGRAEPGPDFAALNNMEMLPWDVWGAMPRGTPPSGADLELFDRLAALTRKPDSGFDEISRQYSENDRLRVPRTVFNGLLRRDEAV